MYKYIHDVAHPVEVTRTHCIRARQYPHRVLFRAPMGQIVLIKEIYSIREVHLGHYILAEHPAHMINILLNKVKTSTYRRIKKT